jgi:hypothetical protein
MKKIFLTYTVFGLFLALFGAAQTSAQAKNSWSGEWRVPSRFAPATLRIYEATAREFKFRIEAARGANTGEIAGVAKIRGNKAYYDDRTSKMTDVEPRGCRLTFTNKKTAIDVEMNNECTAYGGSGVFFAQVYYKGKRQVREKDFVVLEVFPNARLDGRFKALVGGDYGNFLNSFHLIDEREDLDDLNAKVYAACVMGICPTNAALIMYDARGNFWAAVLDLREGADEVFANYYTNAPEWTAKMPQTLEKWVAEKREVNDKLTVVYKNKK